MANIILQLKAKHFEQSNFIGRSKYSDPILGACPIEIAFYDLIGEPFLACLDEGNTDYGVDYKFNLYYGGEEFRSDKEIAQSHNFDETVIREIELIEV